MKKMEEMKNKKSKINEETDSSSFRYLLSSKISNPVLIGWVNVRFGFVYLSSKRTIAFYLSRI